MYKNGIFCGCFDIYHVGHQIALLYCVEQCEVLTIGILTDEAIFKYKGHYPAVDYEYRKALVHSIFPLCPIIPIHEHKVHDFNAYDVYFVSEEKRGKSLLVDETYEGEVKYFPRYEGISSSAIRKKLTTFVPYDMITRMWDNDEDKRWDVGC